MRKSFNTHGKVRLKCPNFEKSVLLEKVESTENVKNNNYFLSQQ